MQNELLKNKSRSVINKGWNDINPKQNFTNDNICETAKKSVAGK